MEIVLTWQPPKISFTSFVTISFASCNIQQAYLGLLYTCETTRNHNWKNLLIGYSLWFHTSCLAELIHYYDDLLLINDRDCYGSLLLLADKGCNLIGGWVYLITYKLLGNEEIGTLVNSLSASIQMYSWLNSLGYIYCISLDVLTLSYWMCWLNVMHARLWTGRLMLHPVNK